MILIGSGHSRLDASVILSETEAPARARASFPKWVVEGRATTTTAPARYFLKIYSETPWPERPPRGPRTEEGRSRSRLPRNLLREGLAREAAKRRNGALARDGLAIQSTWRSPSHDDTGSRSILPHKLLREALAIELAPPPLNTGTALSFETLS